MPFPFVAAGAAALGRRALGAAGRGILKAGRALGAKTVGGAVARTAGGAIVTTAAGAAASGAISRLSRPSLMPPTQGGGFPAPRPREGMIGRTISRTLPGGMTGREFTQYGDGVDKYGRPLAVYPEEVTQVRGPKGYVVVDWDGERVAVQKGVAVKLGLYTPPPKPPVSGWDMRAINRAHSAKKRVGKLAKRVGFKGCKVGRC